MIWFGLHDVQAERAKQDGRTKEEAVKKLEDSLRSTEVKLKVKEHLYQTLLDKVCHPISPLPIEALRFILLAFI